MKYKAQTFSNRWIMGNLVIDKYGEKYIIPNKNVCFEDGIITISHVNTIKQSTVCKFVFNAFLKDFYQDDIVEVFVKDGKPFVGRIECIDGTWGIYTLLGKGLHLSSVLSNEVTDIVKLGNFHTHREQWMRGWK